MTCKRIELGAGAAVWSCSRGPRTPPPMCERCGAHPATLECGFELRGARAGQSCGKKLCRRCANGTVLCPPHAKLANGGRP